MNSHAAWSGGNVNDLTEGEVRVRARGKAMIPPELAHKISPWMVNSAEMGSFAGKFVFLGIGAFMLSGYAPEWTGNADYNGFLLLLGPWISPALIALLWSALFARKRFRIYQGSPFAKHRYVDTGDDPVAMRLAELVNSKEARHHLWRETLKMSAVLFAILGTTAIIQWSSLNWAYPSPENHFLILLTRKRHEPGDHFWFGLLGCSLFVLVALVSDYQRWCLVTWARREAANKARA